MNRVPVKVSPEHDICQVCGLLPQVDHEEGVGILNHQYIHNSLYFILL